MLLPVPSMTAIHKRRGLEIGKSTSFADYISTSLKNQIAMDGLLPVLQPQAYFATDADLYSYEANKLL